jgi:hypothetical protein
VIVTAFPANCFEYSAGVSPPSDFLVDAARLSLEMATSNGGLLPPLPQFSHLVAAPPRA